MCAADLPVAAGLQTFSAWQDAAGMLMALEGASPGKLFPQWKTPARKSGFFLNVRRPPMQLEALKSNGNKKAKYMLDKQ